MDLLHIKTDATTERIINLAQITDLHLKTDKKRPTLWLTFTVGADKVHSIVLHGDGALAVWERIRHRDDVNAVGEFADAEPDRTMRAASTHRGGSSNYAF